MIKSKLGLLAGLAAISAALILLAAGCSGSATPSSAAKTGDGAAVTGYANPDLLAETDWLAQNLADSNLRIVDVRTADEYKSGHIKGAVNIPVEATFLPTGPKGIVGTADQIASLFGGKGIGDDSRVVVYDAGKDTKASRVFWTLEYYGHQKVSVLNGGFKKWQKENKETSTTEPSLASVKFNAKDNPARRALLADVSGAIGKSGSIIVDARSAAEYTGDDVRSKRGGHVPGAVNVEWLNLFNGDDTFKSAAEMAKIYQDKGVTKDKEAYAY